MSTVSLSLPSDGETIDAADYNTPLNTLLTDYNGNIDNSNIASNAAIAGSKLADGGVTNAKLASTTGEVGGAWQTYTPTWTNISVGNGTVTARYTQVGKKVTASIEIVWGSTTSISGQPSFTLPVTSKTYPSLLHLGFGSLFDNSASAIYPSRALWTSTTTASCNYLGTTGSASSSSAIADFAVTNAPFIWAVNDRMNYMIEYEAA